jgi:hypothetical protein
MYIFALIFGGGSDSAIPMDGIKALIISSAATSLSYFVFYSNRELSRTEMRVRYIIHYLFVLIIMLFMANYMNWINLKAPVNVLIFASSVTAIYIIVIMAGFYQTKRLADELNKKLTERYKM